jgi:FkbM family methyltransferase
MILTGGPTFRYTLQKEFLDTLDPYGIRSCGPVDTIIDLGANCGMFSLLARFVHPAARIIGLEPDPANYAAYRQNADHLRIEAVHGAIGSGRPVRLVNPGTSPGSIQYAGEPAGDVATMAGDIPSFPLPVLWEKWQPHGRIFLKIDIEGAETHFVGDTRSEACIEECVAVGAELHAGTRYGNGFTAEKYQEWLTGRFSTTHAIYFDPSKHPSRLMNLRMLKNT